MNIEWDILLRVIKNKPQQNDLERFDVWYKNSNQEQKLFIDDAKNFYAKNNIEFELSETEITKAWQKQQKLTNRNRFINLLKYVASIALFISLSVSAVFLYQKYEPETAMTTIPQGSKQATLVLADGSRYDLSKPIKNITKLNVAKITNKNKALVIEKKQQQNTLVKTLKYNTIVVPKLGEYKMQLSDGTVVHLNALSSLKFPLVFGANKREVYVDGEAYFEVAHNKNKPFIVHCRGAKVIVLGTEFNIRSYNNKIETTLVKGAVEINTNTSRKAILKPGEQAVIDKEQLQIVTADITSVTAWRYGRFIFENKSLAFIMNELSRWYDINIVYEQKDLRNIKFYVYVNRSDDFKKIISKFDLTDKVKIKIENNNVIIDKH